MKLQCLRENLFQVILLLIGLYIVQVAILWIGPVFTEEAWLWVELYYTYSFWIANIVFGVIMCWLIRKQKSVMIPVGILSVLLPLYGALFYLLIQTITVTNDE